MSRAGRPSAVLVLVLTGACAIETSGLGELDAGATDGGPRVREDAARSRLDGGLDAGRTTPDATPIVTEDGGEIGEPVVIDGGPTCVPATEICNGVDDDCDGAVDETDCPCPVGEHAGHVYLACTGESEGWNDARSFCTGLGYDLVVIDDAAENEAVRMRILDDTWIGLNDRASEGDYVWVDGTRPGYLNWRPGDAPRGASSPTYDCVEIDATTGEWLDVGCGGGRPFVCEADPDR